MGAIPGRSAGTSVLAAVSIVIGVVLSFIGLNIVAQPLAAAVVTAGAVENAAYLATFLKLLPLLITVGILGAVFATNLAYGGTSSIGVAAILGIITVIVAVVMLDILLTNMSDTAATYAKNICVATAPSFTASTAEYCASTSIATATKLIAPSQATVDAAWTRAAAAGAAGTFTAIGQLLPIVVLGYIISIVTFVMPSQARSAVGSRVRGFAGNVRRRRMYR